MQKKGFTLIELLLYIVIVALVSGLIAQTLISITATNQKIVARKVVDENLDFAFKKLKQLFGKKLISQTEIELRSDSELLVKQLTGQYKVLDSKIQNLFLEAWNLKIDFKKIRFKLIPREKNKEADELVNQAL